jgi:hypothetical protein
MARAGDTFTELTEDADEKKAKKEREKKAALGPVSAAYATSRHPSLTAGAAREMELEQEGARSAEHEKVRLAKEQAYAAKAEAERIHSQELISKYGTDDPLLASKVAATGAFEGDLAQRMAMDPDTTKASVEHAAALLGRGGASDAFSDVEGPPAPGRTYSRGVGAHGEPYFTNLTPDELQAERHDTERILGKRGPAPVRDLKRIPGMQDQPQPLTGGKPTPSTAAEILFEGRMEQARSLTSKPETELEQYKKGTELFQELFKEKDITTAREKLDEMLFSGELGRRGVTAKTVGGVDEMLRKRAKSIQEFADPTIDRLYFKPWHAGDDKPGLASDPSQPASLINPGGSIGEGEVAHKALEQAQSERNLAIEQSMPRELPRTAQIARGMSPTTQRLKKQATESAAERKRKQREKFGFEYEPPSIAGLFGFGE